MNNKLVSTFLFGGCCMVVCAAFAFTELSPGQIVYVRKVENLREAPQGSKLGVLDKGTAVVVLEDSPNWVKVRAEGWIWKESLTDSKLALGGGYRAHQIMVQQLSTAESLLAQLKKGASFEELAKKFSIGPAAGRGGDLGYFRKGDFQPEFETAILALKPGEFSEVIKGSAGYHIFKRVE